MTVRTSVGVALLAAFVALGTGCTNANRTNAELDGYKKQNEDFKVQLDAARAEAAAAEARANAALQQPPAGTGDMGTPGMEGIGGPLDMSAGGGPVTPRGRGTAATPAGRGTVAGRGPTAPTVAGANTSVNGAGEVTIEISGDVLFDSGKATIKPAAKKTLDNVAATLKSKYSGQMIRVEGHTDSNPVKNSGWDNNYDLGAARATAVLQYLASKGVPEKNMYPASFGANKPKSKTNLALNRRVEIVVVKNAK